jgi:hypothetical protein
MLVILFFVAIATYSVFGIINVLRQIEKMKENEN